MQTSVSKIDQIYEELLLRIKHISIALLGQKRPQLDSQEQYDLFQTGTPKVGETEYAFFMWNCAILTAFRNEKGLNSEENLARNIKRNEDLKMKLISQSLMFRSVSGRYREAHWEKPVEEICFFVTNTKDSGAGLTSHGEIKAFFRKVFLMAEYYDQDSFLFTFPGANRVAFLIATNNNARREFRGDVKFAGPLFTHVQDIGDWTECSDGRISFRLKGMIVKGGTGNEKVRIGEGNIFDIAGYNPDGVIVIRGNNQKDLKNLCEQNKGAVHLNEHVLRKEQLSLSGVRTEVMQSLNEMVKSKCKRIAFHCSASVGGSFVRGAKIALDAVKTWSQTNRRLIKEIIIVDIYGEYDRVLAIDKMIGR